MINHLKKIADTSEKSGLTVEMYNSINSNLGFKILCCKSEPSFELDSQEVIQFIYT